jgi:hypothetical protein
LVFGRTSGIDYVPPEDIEAILTNLDFIPVLWHTVTSRPIQYRAQWGYVEIHKELIHLGVPTSAIPMTSELEAREAEGERRGEE